MFSQPAGVHRDCNYMIVLRFYFGSHIAGNTNLLYIPNLHYIHKTINSPVLVYILYILSLANITTCTLQHPALTCMLVEVLGNILPCLNVMHMYVSGGVVPLPPTSFLMYICNCPS